MAEKTEKCHFFYTLLEKTPSAPNILTPFTLSQPITVYIVLTGSGVYQEHIANLEL